MQNVDKIWILILETDWCLQFIIWVLFRHLIGLITEFCSDLDQKDACDRIPWATDKACSCNTCGGPKSMITKIYKWLATTTKTALIRDEYAEKHVDVDSKYI